MTTGPMLLFLHVVGVVIWVGGMFFAYVCLRPAAVEVLEPPLRIRLWKQVFHRFFPAVWGAVTLILVSGISMLVQVGFANAPLHWHLMFLTGLVMMAIFAGVVAMPYRHLSAAVARSDWPAGATALGRIRQLVAINLTLGVVTVAIATLGRWL